MFPSSRPTNVQHNAQRPSIIRTRSQQQQPLAPVDLYASPLKEAIRNYNHRQTHTTHQAEYIAAIGPQITELSGVDADEEVMLSPSHKKRPLSPSFVASDHAGKRVRVLGQSSKVNSLSRRHSEESLGTPHKEPANSAAKALYTPKRAMSSGSPSKEITHLDLTKLSGSPAKTPGSPTKTFKITTLDGGTTMRIPVTPRRAVAGGSGLRTPSAPYTPRSPSDKKSPQRAARFSSPAAALVQQSTAFKKLSSTLPHHNTPPTSTGDGVHLSHDTNAQPAVSSAYLHFKSTPIRSRLIASDTLFGGSPLTPLPPTPHPLGSAMLRRPTLPHSSSDESLRNIEFKPGGELPSSIGPMAGQPSPTKSRIPILVPSASSASRLPRPPSSLSISNLPPADPSSPSKTSRPHSAVKPKTRMRGKPKSGVRSKAPFTRLAAKRGVRRTSSLGVGLRPGASSSAASNVPPPSSENPGPETLGVNAVPGTERKKSLVTSSLLSTENATFLKPHSVQAPTSSVSASPSKPTPLSALSIALQKLLATPPAAPPPRSRPNTSLGFTRPNLPAQAQDLHPAQGKDVANVGLRVPGSSGATGASLPRCRTSLGHSRPLGLPKGLGKMGLPLRRPGTAGNVIPTPRTGAPFASKQTSLSTVLASPSRSAAALSESNAPAAEGDDALPSSQGIRTKVVDVDTWVAPAQQVGGTGKGREKYRDHEYLVPLADELETKLQSPPELVSPSRRASQASLSLTQSLSLPRAPLLAKPLVARAASTSTALQINPRTPVKTRGRTRPPAPAPEPAVDGNANAKQNDPMGGKRSNARMPGSLDVLRNCVIFVDVRTEEGEDAAGLFVDMLRGLGARILAKPGKSCTHLVYKAGLPSTITRYKLLPEPRPLPIGIGWVVECVEKREHVDETKFLVNMNEIGVAGGAQRRRSMQPKQMKMMSLGQLDNGEAADISVRADSSFTSEEPSTTGLVLTGLSPPTRSSIDNLPPLERARQRSLRVSRE